MRQIQVESIIGHTKHQQQQQQQKQEKRTRWTNDNSDLKQWEKLKWWKHDYARTAIYCSMLAQNQIWHVAQRWWWIGSVGRICVCVVKVLKPLKCLPTLTWILLRFKFGAQCVQRIFGWRHVKRRTKAVMGWGGRWSPHKNRLHAKRISKLVSKSLSFVLKPWQKILRIALSFWAGERTYSCHRFIWRECQNQSKNNGFCVADGKQFFSSLLSLLLSLSFSLCRCIRINSLSFTTTAPISIAFDCYSYAIHSSLHWFIDNLWASSGIIRQIDRIIQIRSFQQLRIPPKMLWSLECGPKPHSVELVQYRSFFASIFNDNDGSNSYHLPIAPIHEINCPSPPGRRQTAETLKTSKWANERKLHPISYSSNDKKKKRNRKQVVCIQRSIQ